MILEVFCCSGGMAEGLRRAGVQIDAAVDFDTDACDSYEANHGHRPIQIDARDLLRMAEAGWRPGPVDLLIADPPCTPWSRAGKRRGMADERDMLGVTIRLVDLLRPHAYLIANVPGLDDAPNWPVVQREIGGLARSGYCVADFARLDAADYGVPQRRVRPFWFGHLSGPCLRWPEPTHCDPALLHTHPIPGTELRPWVTVREALAHLSPTDMGRPVRLRWKQYDPAKGAHKPSEPDGPSRTVTRNANGDGVLIRAVATKGHPHSHWDEPSHTIPASMPGNGASLVAHPKHRPNRPDAPSCTVTVKESEGVQGWQAVEWPWDRPSTTVCSGAVLSPPKRSGRDGTSQRGNPNAVVLSEKAAAILQGFAESWRFCGQTKASRWSQLGQAMPPPLAHAVGHSIARWMAARKAAA